ncbi:hypothetical protein PMIN07_004560 [Paraphaeosphaeria minitans]
MWRSRSRGNSTSPSIRNMTDPRNPHASLHPQWAQPNRLLQSTYIDPFIRIERSDGIVIPTATHMEKLKQIHFRYLHMGHTNENSTLHMLWVPGFEPSYDIGPDIEELEEAPPGMMKTVFSGEDMYQRYGERRGAPFAEVKDRKGWQRKLWDLPRGKIAGTREEIPSEWLTQMTCQKNKETGQRVLRSVKVGPKESATGLLRGNTEGVEIRFVGVWTIQQMEGAGAENAKRESIEEEEEETSASVVEGVTSMNYASGFKKSIKQEEGSTVSNVKVE